MSIHVVFTNKPGRPDLVFEIEVEDIDAVTMRGKIERMTEQQRRELAEGLFADGWGFPQPEKSAQVHANESTAEDVEYGFEGGPKPHPLSAEAVRQTIQSMSEQQRRELAKGLWEDGWGFLSTEPLPVMPEASCMKPCHAPTRVSESAKLVHQASQLEAEARRIGQILTTPEYWESLLRTGRSVLDIVFQLLKESNVLGMGPRHNEDVPEERTNAKL